MASFSILLSGTDTRAGKELFAHEVLINPLEMAGRQFIDTQLQYFKYTNTIGVYTDY